MAPFPNDELSELLVSHYAASGVPPAFLLMPPAGLKAGTEPFSTNSLSRHERCAASLSLCRDLFHEALPLD